MSAIRVSVLMPVLNPHPVFFRQAVDSILSQSLKELELVIVEDPSPNSAATLLAGLNDSRMRHYANPTRTSLPEQRNRALHEAHGELVAIHDADDISEPDRLLKQSAFLDEHPEIGVAGSQLTIIDHEGKPCGKRVYPTEHKKIVKAMRRFNPLGHSAVMARRAAMLGAGGYQMNGWTEDYDLWCRLARAGVGFANVDEAAACATVFIRCHPSRPIYGERCGTHWP